jgi:hypothetical protein
MCRIHHNSPLKNGIIAMGLIYCARSYHFAIALRRPKEAESRCPNENMLGDYLLRVDRVWDAARIPAAVRSDFNLRPQFGQLTAETETERPQSGQGRSLAWLFIAR